jgi:hypothetical protein
LAKKPLEQPITLHRGTVLSREFPNVKVGDVVTEKGYLSTSTDPSTVSRFGFGDPGHRGPGGGHLILHAPAGTPAYYAGGYDQESEMLLGRGLNLHIDHVLGNEVEATIKPGATIGATPFRGKTDPGSTYFETSTFKGYKKPRLQGGQRHRPERHRDRSCLGRLGRRR